MALPSTLNFFSGGIYLLGFTLLSISLARYRSLPISHLLGFYSFLTLQYGPHTAYLTQFFQASATVYNDEIHSTYNITLGLYFTLLALGISTLPKTLVQLTPTRSVPRLKTDGRLIRFGVVLAGVLCVVSIVLQPGIRITLVHLEQLAGMSMYSYTEVRRVLFADTLWSSYAALVRYTLLPIAFSALVYVALQSRSLRRKILYSFFAILVPLVVAIQVNKLFYVFFALLAALIILNRRSTTVLTISLRKFVILLPVLLGGAAALFGALYFLYLYQYAEALQRGVVSTADLQETLLYRVFFASSDALRLWLDYFTRYSEPLGLNAIPRWCAIFGEGECLNTNTFIPFFYLRAETTSMQASGLATGISMFGPIFGVIFVALIMLILLAINGYAAYTYRNMQSIKLVAPHLFLLSFFLTTRELQTAMLSGGALLAPAVYVAIRRLRLKP